MKRCLSLASLVASGACLASLPLQAQTLKPGLWEMSTKMQSASGQMESQMAQAQKQMAALPPEQRKMMEEMMARQGVKMGGTTPGGGMTVKVCLTKEMVERNEVPAQQGDCKTTTQPRSGNSMKMSFVCTNPASSGEGQVTFVSPEAYTSKMNVNTTVQGRPEKMAIDANGKWLAADCGNVRPLAMPKK